MASECVKALGRYLDLGPVTRQRSSRNSFQVVCLTRQCFLPDADSFSQHLGLAVVPCQLRQGRGSDNRCSWRRTSPVTTKSSCSQQLQSTQVSLEYNRIPVLCSLTSGSARASPKGEPFCKGIPYGAAREGAFVAKLRSAVPWHAKFAFDFGLSDTRMLASPLNWIGNDLSPPCQERASFVQKCCNHVITARERIAVGARSPTVWRSR